MQEIILCNLLGSDFRFCMTNEETELLTDICDFTTLFYLILRRKSSKWLELSMQSDLHVGMWFATPSHSHFCFLQTLFLVEEQVIKKRILLILLVRQNTIVICMICDILFFSVREPC